MNEYFSGKKLYGDDFNLKQIKEWYDDEKEGYSQLKGDYEVYSYHEINKIHGYSKIKKIKIFDKVLSIGGATGEELIPIINKINEIFIIEPSKKLRKNNLMNKKIKYISPSSKGNLKFKNNTFDLITCFGTLHHIPNVSYVLKEMSKVVKKNGYILLREPIVSMGDWRKPRIGLTKRERGIPENILDKIIKENSLKIVSKRKIMFPLLRRLNYKNKKAGNNVLFVYFDYLISKLFFWNNKYHSTNFYQKLRPQSIFYVLKKN
ncbi:MAG: class I SAM-dependent methyltransferase [Candidatus Pacearchaeota archaeon]|jgi:ubiquinone/menaquinone biosynthesis C-methylase UbiE